MTGPGTFGKKNAEKLRRKREAELITGTYQSADRKTWDEFVQEYEAKVVSGLAVRSQSEVISSLATFKRIMAPGRVSCIKTSDR